jgi:Holliday junction resolvase RusA-like endonuclease
MPNTQETSPRAQYDVKQLLLAEFEIWGLPKTTNALNSLHWAKRYKEAMRWKNLVMTQCLLKKIQGAVLTKCQLELKRFSSKEPDFDGMVGSWKHVIDALVQCQAIIDDKPSVIGSPIFLWEKVKPKEGRIGVKIYKA